MKEPTINHPQIRHKGSCLPTWQSGEHQVGKFFYIGHGLHNPIISDVKHKTKVAEADIVIVVTKEAVESTES